MSWEEAVWLDIRAGGSQVHDQKSLFHGRSFRVVQGAQVNGHELSMGGDWAF